MLSVQPMKPSCLALILIVIQLFGDGSVSGEPVKIELPPESVTLAPGSGAEIAAAQCLTCHSSEYLSTQPRLPRAYWKGAVEKMQQKFGAPIPAEQVEPLVDYLVKAYGITTPAAESRR
jgi:hypothetical protein